MMSIEKKKKILTRVLTAAAHVEKSTPRYRINI